MKELKGDNLSFSIDF